MEKEEMCPLSLEILHALSNDMQTHSLAHNHNRLDDRGKNNLVFTTNFLTHAKSQGFHARRYIL